MDTWEYREAIHDDYTTSLTDALNVEGAMGWELVGVMPRYYREPGHTFGRNVLRLVFKRKVASGAITAHTPEELIARMRAQADELERRLAASVEKGESPHDQADPS